MYKQTLIAIEYCPNNAVYSATWSKYQSSVGCYYLWENWQLRM